MIQPTPSPRPNPPVARLSNAIDFPCSERRLSHQLSCADVTLALNHLPGQGQREVFIRCHVQMTSPGDCHG